MYLFVYLDLGMSIISPCRLGDTCVQRTLFCGKVCPSDRTGGIKFLSGLRLFSDAPAFMQPLVVFTRVSIAVVPLQSLVAINVALSSSPFL